MTQTLSVLEKAQQLQAEANRLREDVAGRAEVERVSARIDDTAAMLSALQQAVSTARRLNRRTTTAIDLNAAINGSDQFSRVAMTGLPPNSVFTNAQQAIRQATEQINRQVATGWKTWTADQINVLPLLRLTVLAVSEQTACHKRLDELQRLARKTAPSPSDVDLFAASYDLLADSLDSVDDLEPEVLAILQRLGQKPPTTLQDLNDDEISLLRVAGIAGQVELHRRGA